MLFDKLEKRRADAIAGEQEPLASPPADPSDPNKLPEPSLATEDDAAKEDPDVEGDTRGEYLRLKFPVTSEDQSVGGLPHPPDEEEENRGD